MSSSSLVGKQSNDCIWDYSIRHVPMLTACCLKGPHLHSTVCNVLSLSLLLSCLLANVNWKGNQTIDCTCHWDVSQGLVNGMAWAETRKKRAKRSLDTNCRLCFLLILIILKGVTGASVFAHKPVPFQKFAKQSKIHSIFIYMAFAYMKLAVLWSTW